MTTEKLKDDESVYFQILSDMMKSGKSFKELMSERGIDELTIREYPSVSIEHGHSDPMKLLPTLRTIKA